MTRPSLSDQQQGFSGGVNLAGDDLALQPNQVKRAENARLTTFGGISKRMGTQRLHATTLGAIQGGFCWRKASSVEHIVVANGVFYSGGATYAIPMTWTSKAMSAGAALSTTAKISFAPFRDGTQEVLYLADGSSTLIKWDGATLARVAGTPNLARLAVYNQRLLGVTGVDQTIHYSSLNNGDGVGVVTATSGSAVVRTFSNQRLTTIATLRNSLAMWHVSGISRYIGLTQDDIAIAAGAYGFSNDVGTEMPNSVVVVDGLAYFCSNRGAYSLSDAGYDALDSPDKPDPTASYLAALASTDFAGVSGVHDRTNREIRWFIPGAGVFCYNYRLTAWTGPWTGAYNTAPTSAQWDAVDTSSLPIVLWSGTDGFARRADAPGIFKDDVLSDATGGSAVAMAVTCRRMFSTETATWKALRWAYVFADLKGSTTAAISWYTQTASGSYTLMGAGRGGVWGTGTWGSGTWGGTGSTVYPVPLSGVGPFVDVTISDDGNAAPLYSRVELEAFDYGRRG